MIPAGYMAKSVAKRPEWLKAEQVVDIYSVSGCVSENFADYMQYWRHNGYGLFDSPDAIESVAEMVPVSLVETSLFYYELYDLEFDNEEWVPVGTIAGLETNVVPPNSRILQGFDVATFSTRHAPECSPLSCNSMAEEIRVNSHCLFDSFDEAKAIVSDQRFNNSEPGPYRILAVYSTEWPV